MKYRKKPIIIEAQVWNGVNGEQVCDFMGWRNVTIDEQGLRIHTLEGSMHANVGDYIIKGIRGEFYPCKPNIFYATYEMVKP